MHSRTKRILSLANAGHSSIQSSVVTTVVANDSSTDYISDTDDENNVANDLSLNVFEIALKNSMPLMKKNENESSPALKHLADNTRSIVAEKNVLTSTNYSSDSNNDDSDKDANYVPEIEDESYSSSISSNEDIIEAAPSPEIPIQNIANLEVTNNRKKRIWNKKDYCFFCDTEVLKFSRHILRHHSSEHKVQEVLSLPVGSQKRKHMFNQLRNQGNFLKSVTEENIVPVRKPTFSNCEQLNALTYLPCKFCKGFYNKKYLYKHVKKCPHNNEGTTNKIHAQTEGQSLLSAYKENDVLRKEIFPTMRADAVSLTAKTDQLICEVARRYLKSHREKQFRIVATRKMRQLAALLLEIQKEKKIKGLKNVLKPENFDLLVSCTKAIARFDSKTETYGAPSLAANMGTLLKECIDVAYNLAIKTSGVKSDDLNNLKVLKELITNEWRYEVSTIAISDLQQKKWNKPTLIPLAEDLKLLKAYLLSECQKCLKSLEINPEDANSFMKLQEIIYVQLLLLNRRRVGELQRMSVTSYTNNINNQSSDEFNHCISESEKILMNSFKRVVIRGKRGRGVPVLFTENMVKATDMLINLRSKFVQKENVHLFANLKTHSSINGSKAIYKHARLAGAKNAQALTSTRLRKHLATMSQIINMSENDLEQLSLFMGHTSDIHKSYYRLPNDVYQTAKVSKLLLLSEKGELSKYKGKKLEDINIDLEVVEEEENESEDDKENDYEGKIDQEINNQGKISTLQVPPTISIQKPAKNKRVLEPWTEEQKNVTLLHFRNHLKKKLPPKKDECLHLKNQNSQLFNNKTWEKIKIFVVNTYNKK